MAEENHGTITDSMEARCQDEEREKADRQRVKLERRKSEGEVCVVTGLNDRDRGGRSIKWWVNTRTTRILYISKTANG